MPGPGLAPFGDAPVTGLGLRENPPLMAEAPSAPSSPASEQGATDRLRTAAVRGGVLTMGGYVGAQGLRLLSNLVLTRLLFPEAFGLMALVNGFMTALQMFTDLGIRTSIISDKDGEAPRFLNTAWTLSVMRGAGLWLVSCALAWPAARFYGQPQLLELLPVAGLQALILGFHSTASSALSRNLLLGRLTVIDLGVQAVALLTMGLVAWRTESVWALVVGGLTNAVLRTVLSHTVLPGVKNRFLWDREAARKLIRFGRWIFISTILTYVADKSDRLILGATMAIATLGVYNVAAFMAQAIQDGLFILAQKVLLPLYARLAEVDAGGLRARILRVRATLLLLTLPPLTVLVVFPDQVLRALYDDRYRDGAWMLQALAAGSLVGCLGVTATPVLLARGDSFRHMAVLAWRTLTLMVGLSWANARWGVEGQVAAIALNPVLGYPAMAWATRAHGMWMPGLDALALAGSALWLGLLLLIKAWLGWSP